MKTSKQKCAEWAERREADVEASKMRMSQGTNAATEYYNLLRLQECGILKPATGG